MVDELICQLQSDERIDLISAEMYLMIQAERNDNELKRLENLFAENQKAVDNLLHVLMLGRVSGTILAQIEKLERENKGLADLTASERRCKSITLIATCASGF